MQTFALRTFSSFSPGILNKTILSTGSSVSWFPINAVIPTSVLLSPSLPFSLPPQPLFVIRETAGGKRGKKASGLCKQGGREEGEEKKEQTSGHGRREEVREGRQRERGGKGWITERRERR